METPQPRRDGIAIPGFGSVHREVCEHPAVHRYDGYGAYLPSGTNFDQADIGKAEFYNIVVTVLETRGDGVTMRCMESKYARGGVGDLVLIVGTKATGPRLALVHKASKDGMHVLSPNAIYRVYPTWYKINPDDQNILIASRTSDEDHVLQNQLNEDTRGFHSPGRIGIESLENGVLRLKDMRT